jgi:hypothetical protein
VPRVRGRATDGPAGGGAGRHLLQVFRVYCRSRARQPAGSRRRRMALAPPEARAHVALPRVPLWGVCADHGEHQRPVWAQHMEEDGAGADACGPRSAAARHHLWCAVEPRAGWGGKWGLRQLRARAPSAKFSTRRYADHRCAGARSPSPCELPRPWALGGPARPARSPAAAPPPPRALLPRAACGPRPCPKPAWHLPGPLVPCVTARPMPQLMSSPLTPPPAACLPDAPPARAPRPVACWPNTRPCPAP